MGFLAPSPPSPPPIPVVPPAAYPATMANPAVAMAGQNSRAKAAAAAGMLNNSTVLTSPEGTATPPDRATSNLLSGAQ